MVFLSSLSATYNLGLVVLSVLIAAVATFTALDLVGRVRAAQGRESWGWLLAGAFSMGSGIWAMHFVGMLACDMPFEAGYRIDLTIASWVLAALGSLITLYLASSDTLSSARYWSGTVCMASALTGMHYIGMATLDLQPGIVYDPFWVAVSILIALFTCSAGLRIGFNLRNDERISYRLAASVVIGLTMSCVHYAGMQAAEFPVGSLSDAATYSLIDDHWLGLWIANTTILILFCTLIASALDRRLEYRTSEYVQSLEQANLQLQYASRHDPLTKLGNRTLLVEQLHLAIAKAETRGSRFALISFDLDHFKSLNDNLGHEHGDEILRQVGDALNGAVREQDVAARVGGDEFMLLLTSVADGQTIRRVCERLLTQIRAASSNQMRLAASVGVASYPDDGKTGPALLKSADLALYHAKQSGRDQYAFFSAELAHGLERDFIIQNELSAAIKAGEIRPHYQPKYDVRTRQVIGAEALARWHHPRDGMISPGRFVPVAERTNQIGDLQVCLLRRVCADMRDWRAQGLEILPIAFNLSALCLRNADLPQLFTDTLAEFGLSPRDLICEITETAAIPELVHTLSTLRGLRERGIRISLDDFGTGLSSMSYLRDLPVDELKIDRAFVSRLNRENEDEHLIVKAIINLAHSLNLGVVAEGVEHEEQLRKLNRMGCDRVQGFFFSPAITANDFGELLKDVTRSKVIPLRARTREV